VTTGVGFYQRIGNIVQVVFDFVPTVTAAGPTDSTVTVVLPVSRANFATGSDALGVCEFGGTGTTTAIRHGNVVATSGAQTVTVQWVQVTGTGALSAFNCSYMYKLS
jgi:hypothetical protein